VFVFLLLPTFVAWLATLQTAAMHDTKQSGLCALPTVCCTGCFDLFTTRTDCAKICRHIALKSHEMKTLYMKNLYIQNDSRDPGIFKINSTQLFFK